jgi:hypothetical protein
MKSEACCCSKCEGVSNSLTIEKNEKKKIKKNWNIKNCDLRKSNTQIQKFLNKENENLIAIPVLVK